MNVNLSENTRGKRTVVGSARMLDTVNKKTQSAVSVFILFEHLKFCWTELS